MAGNAPIDACPKLWVLRIAASAAPLRAVRGLRVDRWCSDLSRWGCLRLGGAPIATKGLWSVEIGRRADVEEVWNDLGALWRRVRATRIERGGMIVSQLLQRQREAEAPGVSGEDAAVGRLRPVAVALIVVLGILVGVAGGWVAASYWTRDAGLGVEEIARLRAEEMADYHERLWRNGQVDR